MNKGFWTILAVILVILLGGYGLWRSNHEAPSKETVRIGAVLGFTGYAVQDATSIKRGLDLAQADLAAKGVVVDISYQDDSTDPKKTISALQYLLTTYHPDVIVGPTWSFLESAAQPTIDAGKVVAYAPADTSEFVENVSTYQFHGAPRNALMDAPVAKWLKENGKKRIAIVVTQSAWSHTVEAAFKKAATEAGAEVVFLQALPDVDTAKALESVFPSLVGKTPDSILWTGTEPDAVMLVQQIAKHHLNVPVIAASSVYRQIASSNTVSTDTLKNVYQLETPVSAEFIAKYKAKYGEEPTAYADRAYDGLMLLVEAIQNAPAKDGDSIAKYLREETSYRGFGGRYEFDQNGDAKEGVWEIHPVVQ